MGGFFDKFYIPLNLSPDLNPMILMLGQKRLLCRRKIILKEGTKFLLRILEEWSIKTLDCSRLLVTKKYRENLEDLKKKNF